MVRAAGSVVRVEGSLTSSREAILNLRFFTSYAVARGTPPNTFRAEVAEPPNVHSMPDRPNGP